MPANKDDISFGFDTQPFQNAMGQIDKKLGLLKVNTLGMAKAISTGMTMVVRKLFVLAGSIKGIQGLFGQIPEIGKAFGIAKDVIMKNFLYPLRQAVFPLLQKMLNWVRDNRKTFVVWGENLANVFRVITSGIQGVFKVAKSLESVFLGFINRVFGMQVKNFQELLNLLTFKMAVTIEFLKSIIPDVVKRLQPFIDIFAIGLKGAFETIASFVSGFLTGLQGIEKPIQGILNSVKQLVTNLFTVNKQGNSIQTVFRSIGEIFGKIIKFVADMTDSFLKGFVPAIKNIATPLQKIVDAFKRIFDSIFGSNTILSGFKAIFTFLGNIIGTKIVKGLEAMAFVIDLISKGVELLVKGFEWLVANVSKVVDPVTGFFKGLGKFGSDLLSKINPFDDVIITKQGKIIKPAPDDNIVAFKDNSPLVKNVDSGRSIVVNMGGINISISGADQATGNAIASTIVDELRAALNKELITSGAA